MIKKIIRNRHNLFLISKVAFQFPKVWNVSLSVVLKVCDQTRYERKVVNYCNITETQYTQYVPERSKNIQTLLCNTAQTLELDYFKDVLS